MIERTFYRLKDWCRIDTRSRKLAINVEPNSTIAAKIFWWN